MAQFSTRFLNLIFCSFFVIKKKKCLSWVTICCQHILEFDPISLQNAPETESYHELSGELLRLELFLTVYSVIQQKSLWLDNPF